MQLLPHSKNRALQELPQADHFKFYSLTQVTNY